MKLPKLTSFENNENLLYGYKEKKDKSSQLLKGIDVYIIDSEIFSGYVKIRLIKNRWFANYRIAKNVKKDSDFFKMASAIKEKRSKGYDELENILKKYKTNEIIDNLIKRVVNV